MLFCDDTKKDFLHLTHHHLFFCGFSCAQQHVQTKPHIMLHLKQGVSTISGWPTDVASIDYYDSDISKDDTAIIIPPHTVFMFVPGNPGCIGWYLDMLFTIVQKLGVGHAARAASYAGHAVGDEKIQVGGENDRQRSGYSTKKKSDFAYTIDGQVEHKIDWIDSIIEEMDSIRGNSSIAKTEMLSQNGRRPIKFIFISHSIGAHLVQRLLLLRRDILLQTKLIIHLTPFYRFDPDSFFQKNLLATVANEPQLAISVLKSVGYIFSKIPSKIVDLYMEKVAGIPNEKDRNLAKELYMQPQYAHNFFELGTEEIREVPEVHDEGALRVIGMFCPTSILYCANDHWAPLSHMEEMKKMNFLDSMNISFSYCDQIEHGFIVFPDMVPHVVDFVIQSMTLITDHYGHSLKSKL